eukprot:TRINITY_DN59759_c0_g1_i1.p1 TRINITY_DN59759_c0_g1~~TRINITY_DN59759_c0_g1_i1.p1  ORF type:complete len:255 (-),score=48.36 TRINITY_DN59759_c0_g1_i1:287-1051(-)
MMDGEHGGVQQHGSANGMFVKVRMMSGDLRRIDDLQEDDRLDTLIRKLARALGLVTCEIGLSQGMKPMSPQDHTRTLKDLGISNGSELNFMRLPRLTLNALQGHWVNSKGAKIVVDDDEARVSGMVNYPIRLDEEGTVIGVADHLEVIAAKGLDSVSFRGGEMWHRVRENDPDIGVILRTVGGASWRVDGFAPDDKLSALRSAAYEKIKDDCCIDSQALFFRLADVKMSANDDNLSLRQLGIKDGITLLCLGMR